MPDRIPDSFEIRVPMVNATYDGDSTVEVRRAEFRAADDAAQLPAGYDAYISTWMTVDDYGSFFVRGSAKKSLKERAKNHAPVLWNHDIWAPAIGRHLDAFEDDTGVRVSVAINQEVRTGAETLSNLRFGVPIGQSFGFTAIKDRRATEEELKTLDFSVAPDYMKSWPASELRAVLEYKFWESSPVTFGSNAKAKADQIRSIAPAAPEVLASLLRDIRAGSLDPQLSSTVQEIVNAFSSTTTGAGTTHPTGGDELRTIANDPELAELFRDIDFLQYGIEGD